MTYRASSRRTLVSTRELNRFHEAADRVLLNGRQVDLAAGDTDTRWVWVQNDSGADREAYEALDLGDPLFNLLDDGTVDLAFSGESLSSAGVPAILIEPVASGEAGRSIISGMSVAWVGPGTGTHATPDAANHRLEPGDSGSIKLLGSPDGTNAKLLPVLLNVGGSSGQAKVVKFFRTPSAGIDARSGATLGSASCTPLTLTGGTRATSSPDETVYNDFTADIGGQTDIAAARVDGIWVVIAEDCP